MEKVFCIARKDLEVLTATPLPQGGLSGPPLHDVLALDHYFIPRPEAEQDPAWKQIIPYQLFCCGASYFVYRRGSKVGEQRLSGRLSLGIGGHLNRGDSSNGRMKYTDYEAGLSRERAEELVCSGVLTPRFIGWINDDSDSVGQVHLGAVHLCSLESREQIQIQKNGEDIHPVGWLDFAEITARRDLFEKWSLLALKLAEKNTS